MIKYEDNLTSRINGNNLQPLQGASVAVTSLDTGLPASLYSDNGVTPLAQPLTTDNNGYFGFYAPDGKYKLTFSGSRFATFTRQIVLEDPADNPYATKAELAAGTGSALVTFTQAGAGAVPRTVQDRMREVISVTDFGAKGDGVTDDTDAIARAWAYAKTRGGTLRYPKGTYRQGEIDLSGSFPSIILEGEGSLIIPASATQPHSCLFYANNNTGTTGSFLLVPVVFKHVRMQAWTQIGVGNGDLNYCVNFRSSAAHWYESSFELGKIASYYGCYHQYGEFYSCVFGAAYSTNSSAGCLLDGNTSAEASNENRFYSPKFFSNKNGLVIKGGIKNRIFTPTVQDTKSGGVGGIVLDSDASGFGNTGTEIRGGYGEINQVDHIKIKTADNWLIDAFEFVGGTMSTDTCYAGTIINCPQYGTVTATITHPAGNTDVASLTFHGNSFDAVLNLGHAGPTRLDYSSAATRTLRNDNMLTSTGQTDQNSIPIRFIRGWGGKKTAPKGVATQLFSLTQESFNTLAYREAKLEIRLWLNDNANSTSQYGYSGRIQSFLVSITNNNTGVPQVQIKAGSISVDFSVDETWQVPGPVTLTASVSGDTITFSASWSGAGNGLPSMTSQSVRYTIEGAVNNAIYMTRL